MDGCRDYQTKGRKSERERQMSYEIAYRWNLKRKKRYKRTYLQNRKKTHRHRKQTHGYQRAKEMGQIRRLGFAYTLYYT